MPEVLDAHRVYKKADADALFMRRNARAYLGLAVVNEIAKGTTIENIARKLEVSAEQIRRYRQAYRDWVRDFPGRSPKAP